ncbi:MAG TPA: alpha/beta fold hydrolase [Longimicrobium sp.]|nr:alpha/beta fold hydrolase [Longimicrobium sp.]
MTTTRRLLEHDGCRLDYQLRGDSGTSVLLIQGVGVHGDGWLPQVDALSTRHRCLWFDNRGMGRSQPLAGALTVERMANDALALLDAEGWPAAHVVGHSLGGVVAQRLALAAPGRVRSLSLLCTFARGAEATRMSLWMAWVGMRTRIGPRRMRRAAFLRLVMTPAALASADRDALARELAPLFGHDLADQPPVAMRQLSAMRAYDATPRLGELAGIPTLVVSAAHDRIARPELGRALAAGIPGARHVEFADASHGLPISHAAEVNALLLDHLEKADTAWTQKEEGPS